jgi:hypothetical protein
MAIRCIARTAISYLIVFAAILFGGCAGATSLDGTPSVLTGSASTDYAPPETAGTIESDDIKESSGLAVSKCQPNVLWTHNDGGEPLIFAMSTEGRHLGVWRIPNAQNVDWEDIAEFKDAAGKCFLLIGDIGTNKSKRAELTVYRVAEPVVSGTDAASSGKRPLTSASADVMRFGYSGEMRNAETLMVHPVTGDIYILTKQDRGPSTIHRLKPVFGSAGVKTEKIADISMPADKPGLLTGGSISPDGNRVILCDLQNGYELVLRDGAVDFNDIWRQAPRRVDLGNRKQGEGVTYSADGNAIYASSEKKNPPLMRVRRR